MPSHHQIREIGCHVLLIGALFLATAVGCERPAAETPEETAAWDLFLKEQRRYHSLGREEVIIRHFFRNRPGGFFLDVGAAHFRKYSNTFYLEKHLGWSGIAIDALEHWATDYATRRPRTKFFTYIVTDRSGAEAPFFRVKGNIGSTAVQERATWLGELLPVEEVMVPTITLDELLDRENVTKIDLLSMDIEQGEPAALAGFDIQRFRPELVCIEATPDVHDAILEYFTRHGYRRIELYLEYDRVNWYFTPQR